VGEKTKNTTAMLHRKENTEYVNEPEMSAECGADKR
jgi:hypothetical protein